MRRWGLTLLLVGCDGIFDLTELPPPGTTDAGRDGSSRDGDPGTCDSDDFTGTSISQYWETFEQLSTEHVSQDGEVIIDLSQAANSAAQGEAGLITYAARDLSTARITIELTQPIGGTMFHTEDYLDLFVDSENEYTLGTSSGKLQATSTVDGAQSQQLTRDYAPTEQRFLRIESHDGLIAFQTSASGGDDFFTQAEVPASFPLTQAHVRLVAGTYGGGEADPGAAKFDNFEVCVQ